MKIEIRQVLRQVGEFSDVLISSKCFLAAVGSKEKGIKPTMRYKEAVTSAKQIANVYDFEGVKLYKFFQKGATKEQDISILRVKTSDITDENCKSRVEFLIDEGAEVLPFAFPTVRQY